MPLCDTIKSWFKNRKVIMLIIFAFLVHLLVLQAVFDIYFSSPVDHGMTPFRSTRHPPANRLVFIVADGLRAEAIFGEDKTINAPNLNYIKDHRGAWGIAHTRVPTESRPGHVALLAGIYEDPAALLKGWKVNPVDFDSVINQSRNAWCWGGPTIINMFNKDNSPHIHLHSYDPKMEDFGNKDTIGLDSWVFDHVKKFIDENYDCDECVQFRQSGNLFFLHLLGTDTAGHAFKPGSREYNENIKFVDSYIPEVEKWFEYAFPDGSTAYIFTADHGMTNWGSHGAGSDHETETPFIAWGKGILKDNRQKDLQQIDVAPLLSAVIGINYPINSLGQLPYHYLNCSMEVISEMMLSNIRQIMEIFIVKMHRLMDNAFRFQPYRGVTIQKVKAKLKYLSYMATIEKYSTFFFECEKLTHFLIEGADYYHNYYQLPILISITIGIVAWIVFLSTYNVKLTDMRPPFGNYFPYIDSLIFLPVYASVLFILKAQNAPFMHYLYFSFPILMVQMVVSNYKYLLEGLKNVRQLSSIEFVKNIATYSMGLKLLAIGFHNRASLTVATFLMASSVFVSNSLDTYSYPELRKNWSWCCLVVSIFPLLPVMTVTFNLYTYLFGYLLWWFAIEKYIMDHFVFMDTVVTYQHILLKLTPLYTLSVEYGFIDFDSNLKYFAIIWSVVPVLMIPFSQRHMFIRCASIFVGFGTFYLMVTTNYESVFLVAYIFLLYYWFQIEGNAFGFISLESVRFNGEIPDGPNRDVSDDFRRAFFFIVLIFIGFFGTGNIASLNSFDPMWVRCFLTVFSPFKMSAIILLRIMIPFIFASCMYRAINILRKGNTLNIFCIVLMYSDIMLLHFLYSVKNVGSWLEIGMSLSEFVIMEAFVLILLILYWLAYILTTYEIPVTIFFI